MYDIIIVGAGPSGLTAAVYAARKQLKTLLVSKDIGGQMNWTMGIENYMGYQFVEGPELMVKFDQQVKQFPIDTLIGEDVNAIIKTDTGFEIHTEDGAVKKGLSMIISTGKKPRPLNVPGEKELMGRGVSYCATCDGPFFRNLKVAVIGGGNSALEAADDLMKTSEHIYLISLTPLTADPILIDRVKISEKVTILTEHETLEIKGEDSTTGIKIKDIKSNKIKNFNIEGVFVEIGLIPNSDIVKDIVKLNESGEIMINNANETGVPGLYAAGDVTNVLEKQIVIAAGEGAKAALQAHKYLQYLAG